MITSVPWLNKKSFDEFNMTMRLPNNFYASISKKIFKWIKIPENCIGSQPLVEQVQICFNFFPSALREFCSSVILIQPSLGSWILGNSRGYTVHPSPAATFMHSLCILCPSTVMHASASFQAWHSCISQLPNELRRTHSKAEPVSCITKKNRLRENEKSFINFFVWDKDYCIHIVTLRCSLKSWKSYKRN